MKYELSPDATQDLDEQLEHAEKPKEGEDDPIEQTVEVPKGGSEEDAVATVQKQFEEKSGLELDTEVARDVVQEPRKDDE